MSIESVLNSALRETENLYKIETYSDESAKSISEFVTSHGCKCAVLGWAVVTNFAFNNTQCLELLPLISTITEDVSDEDKQFFVHC